MVTTEIEFVSEALSQPIELLTDIPYECTAVLVIESVQDNFIQAASYNQGRDDPANSTSPHHSVQRTSYVTQR